MFDHIEPAPRDPILGLSESFREDPNPKKINLSVGVYQDATGKTPILESVRQAGKLVLERQKSMSYLPIPGSPAYASAVQRLMFGDGHEAVTSNRAATSHTPGGTGALRVAGDLIHQQFPKATVWFTQPTWPNHPQIFAAAGVPTKSFPYFDAKTNRLAFGEALAAIEKMPAGDVILLHGCCHNPTGIDPTPDEWKKLADAVYGRGLLPLLDFAYQGFADGILEDASGLLAFARPGAELMVCSSFSKNFGLYCERVGALTIVAKDQKAADTVQSQVKAVIRANYSNPPAHGAELVTTVLSDAELRKQWEKEVAQMRDRINGMRELLVKTLQAKGVPGDYSFITRQRGMFSFSGLTPPQVEALRKKYAIYIVGSGRINVAGITEQNVGPLCEAIAEVVK
ncbi:MAG: aspartate/tyrosine/aromatic aminotransferase [Planctomycetes bacterium]|nr:aspartate/tyrosine/aromatic aminotransferase [Planctomycetota bacterium]